MRLFDREALTVAMALVPGMYARNRFFSLFREPEVRRARARAAVLRGVIKQLSGAHGVVDGVSLSRTGDVVVLRYCVPSLHLERRLELTDSERACLAFLGSRSGVAHLQASADDRAHIEAVLRRLGGEVAPSGEIHLRPSEQPR